MQLRFELIPQFRPHPFDKMVKELEAKYCKSAKLKTLRIIRNEQLRNKQ